MYICTRCLVMLRRKKARMAPVQTVTNMMFLFNSFQKQPQILRCLPLSVGVSKWRKEEICLLAVGFGASQEKWSNLRSIIIPTPLPLAEKSQKRGRLLCRTKVLTGGRRGVDLWESSGLLPLTWFDPHGPPCQGGKFSGKHINLALLDFKAHALHTMPWFNWSW